MGMPTLRAATALTAALLAIPAAAQASTVSYSAGTRTMTIAGTPGADQVSNVGYRDYGSNQGVSVYDASGATPAAGCVADPDYSPSLRQYYVLCAAAPATQADPIKTNVNLGDGNDVYKVYESAFADTVNGGAGNDELNGKVAGDDAGKFATDVIRGDAGNDDISLGSGAGSKGYGDTGDDALRGYYTQTGLVLEGGDGRDDLSGGDWADTLSGGAGIDDIFGRNGSDVIDGGPGDDTITNDYTSTGYDSYGAGPGADDVRGGEGTDTISEPRLFASDKSVTQFWSLDDQPNDGADRDSDGTAEESDNIHSDIENVIADYDPVEIVGSAANNKLEQRGSGKALIVGGGGNDEIYQSSYDGGADGGPGDDIVRGYNVLLGGDGSDELDGYARQTVIDGGAGNDAIDGGTGNDDITGGPGIDSIDGQDGNDVVRAVDGEIDQIGCGIGADVAEVDSNDVLNADPGSLCETTKVTAVASTPPATGGLPQTIGGVPPGNQNAGAVAAILGAGTVKGSVARIGVTAPAPGTVRVLLTTTANGRSATIAKARKLGKATKVVAAAGKVTLKVKLKGKAAKKLKRKKKFKVVVRTTFTPIGSTTGTTTSKTVTIKRK